jgi:alkyl hydroperoxide reductase subunit AhpF
MNTKDTIYDIIIIGGGPAAFTAALYSARKKNRTLLVAKEVGGQAAKTNDIRNWPGTMQISGLDLIRGMRAQIDKDAVVIMEGMGVSRVEKNNDGMFTVILSDGTEKQTKVIIVASGKKPRKLNVPGDTEFENKGLTYCPICDAPLFAGKDVAVIGGGNAGFYAAQDLLKYAKSITILEYTDVWRGDASTKDTLAASGKVVFIDSARVLSIEGGDFVKGIRYKNNKDGTEHMIAVEGVFVEVGSTTNIDFVKGLVAVDVYGQIVVDHKTGATSVPGIFAAGDVTDTPFKQIVIAAGEGSMAALAADEYLNVMENKTMEIKN